MKEKIIKALEKAKSNSKPRKFTQSWEIAINLRDMDLKKPENRVTLYVTLPNGRGKPAKIGAFVGEALHLQAKELCDLVIHEKEFENYQPREMRKIARQIDFFIAQADLMPKIAKYFGKYLAGKGKMPDPKYGGVLPPNANLKPIVEKLKKTVRLIAKKQPVIHSVIGSEDMELEKVAENGEYLINELIKALPRGKENIRSVWVKLSMGPAVRVEW